MVSRLFNQVAALVDPSPHTRNNLKPLRDAHTAIRTAHPGDDPQTRGQRAAAHRELEQSWRAGLAVHLGRLRYLLDRGLDATLPDEAHTGSYAVDCSEVESWAAAIPQAAQTPRAVPRPGRPAQRQERRLVRLLAARRGPHRRSRRPQLPASSNASELTAANATSATPAGNCSKRMVADHELADEPPPARHGPPGHSADPASPANAPGR